MWKEMIDATNHICYVLRNTIEILKIFAHKTIDIFECYI